MSQKAFLDAIQARRTDRAEALLLEDPTLAEARGPDGTSALMLALYLGLDPLAEALVEAGAEPDLFEATVLGDAARVRHLLEQGDQHLSEHSPDGFTPLHLAAHFGRAEVMGLLLNRGADALARSTNPMANTPLHAAAAGCQENAIGILIQEGVDPDARDGMGNTPLHVAAANGHGPSIDRLLAAGADPDATNQDGETPPELAQARGFEGLFEGRG